MRWSCRIRACWRKGVPSITYGLRGLNYYQIEITGPAQDLHSGVFGGAVPNPLTILAEMIAKLHDKNFHVTVPGFYDDVATTFAHGTQSAEFAAVAKKRIFARMWARRLSAAKRDTRFAEQLWCRPTLETERHLGRLHGRGREDGDPVEGARETFHAAGARIRIRAKIAKLVETLHPQAAARDA